jgi:hypothetical protein
MLSPYLRMTPACLRSPVTTLQSSVLKNRGCWRDFVPASRALAVRARAGVPDGFVGHCEGLGPICQYVMNLLTGNSWTYSLFGDFLGSCGVVLTGWLMCGKCGVG